MRNRVPTEYREQLRREQQAQDDRIALASAPRRGGGGSGSVTAGGVSYDPTASGMAAANVQAAIDELDAQKLADAPSDGKTYGRKDSAWAEVVGGGMTLVGSAVVAGAAATELTITGLNLDADGHYSVAFGFQNALGVAVTLSYVFNGDSLATNYRTHAVTAGVSGSPTNSVGNNGRFCGIDASAYVDGDSSIFRRNDGKPVVLSRSVRTNLGGITLIQDFTTMWLIAGNVTSLKVVSDVANSLAIGSHIKIYRMGG